ncbi:hypothetical protein EYR36_010620 [Pleurotus pulmonarius]|nr:hypothetical protein EYR36_010620 [Pleurotus pulmonarius]
MANTGKPPEIPAEFQIYNSYVEDPKWQRKFSIVWASFLGAAILLALPSLLRLVRRRGFSTVFGSWLGGVREDRRRGRYKPVDDHPDGERSKSEPSEHQTTRPKSSAVLNRIRSVMLLTPPGIELNVAQLTLIVGYIILVVVCIVTDAQLIENSNRAGFIAIAQLPPVFLFASKNSVLSLLFGSGYGYEKLNFLHKWSSRSLFLAAVLHGALWIRNHLEWNLPILGEQKETTGVAALGVLCVLVLSSLRPLRRRWYQFFFVIHVLGFVAFFVTLCYHTIYASPWIFPPLAFYGFDILLRLFRYRIKDAELIPVGNQMTIINIRDCTDGWLPGQHVRLRIFFSGRIFESHPLTIMNNPSAGGVAEKKHSSGVEEEDPDKMEGMVLGARVCGDWTRAVNEYALKEGERVRRISSANEKEASTSSTPLPASTSTPVPIQVMIDGPYGGCSIDLGDYENVLLVAGGSGATFSIGMLDDIVKRCAGARTGGEKTRRIEFVWCVKSFGSINWFAALLAPIAELAAASPGLDLHITIFVTCLCDPESVPEIPNMDVILERPDVYKLLEALISPHDEVEEGDVDVDVDVEADAEARAPTPPHHHPGTTSKKHALRWAGFGGGVGICASGPESLTREAANAVARLGLRKGKQCGNGPFARIVGMTVAQDQSIPAHIESKIRRRDGSAPRIHTLRIDDNFAAIDADLCGTVQFAFVGATSPGLDLNSAFTDFFWDDVGKWVGDAVHTVGQAISTAKDWVANAGNWVGDRMHDVMDLVKSLFPPSSLVLALNLSVYLVTDRTSFEISPKVESQDVPLKSDVQFSSQEALAPICPGGTHTKVDVHFKSDGSLKVKAGIVITGSVVPPAITKLAAFGGVDGSVDATLKATVQINGGFKYQKKIIEGLGLPGFSIPGVFTIGPYFELAGRVQGHISIDLQTDIHLNYVFNDIEMWFPKEYENHSKEGGVKTKDSNFGFQASAHLDAQGWLQATLAPQLHLGIWAAAGAVDASIYLEAAAYARASVHVEASAKKRELLSHERSIPAKAGYGGRLASRKLNRREVAFSGCAWLDLGVDLSGGATGKLGPLKADAMRALS